MGYHKYHPLTRLATLLAYRWGINSKDELEGDTLTLVDRKENGRVVYYHNELERYFIWDGDEISGLE